MSNRKTLEEKIAAAKAEAAQMEARIKEMLKQQKAQERKERTHRLCKRGGQVESLLPGLARLTEEQFEIFVKKCLLTDHTKRILSELLPLGSTTDEEEVTVPVQESDAGAPKTTPTAQNGSSYNSHKPTQAATQHAGDSHGKPADEAKAAS